MQYRPRITSNNLIIIWNIYIHILLSSNRTIEKFRTPYLKYWKKQFEESTGLLFEEEIKKMVQKLKKAMAIYFDSGSNQWEIYDEHAFDQLFFLQIEYIKRNYEDIYSLGIYELTDYIINNINDIYKDEFERAGVVLSDCTE